MKHSVEDIFVLVDGPRWLHTALHRCSYRFHNEMHGNQNAVGCVFKYIYKLTYQSEIIFSTHPPSREANACVPMETANLNNALIPATETPIHPHPEKLSIDPRWKPILSPAAPV